MSAPELTLYFDGLCPFCSMEMQRLRRWNHAGKLAFVDVTDVSFDPKDIGVEMEDLDRELHGKSRDGQLLIGIDCILSAYSLVGRGYLVLPLRVRFLRPILSQLYRKFARHRYQISRFLGLKPRMLCESGHCQMKHPYFSDKVQR